MINKAAWNMTNTIETIKWQLNYEKNLLIYMTNNQYDYSSLATQQKLINCIERELIEILKQK